jgi:LPXTG-motif cell wall-anchored protein
MNPRNLLFVVASVIIMGASMTLMSQGLTDGVKVTLPYPVTVGDDVVLEPGQYEIRRPSPTNDQILRFFSNDKFRYQTVAQTIPVEGEKEPEETRVLLHHIGDSYYFDKIWMEGKSYGFEFPLPDKARALQRELAAKAPARDETRSAANALPLNESRNGEQVGSLSTQANDRVDPLAVPERESVQSSSERQEVAALQREQSENNAPAAVDSRQDSAQSSIQRSQSNAPVADNPPAADQLPATASNWFLYMLGGVLLLALAGLSLKMRTQE